MIGGIGGKTNHRKGEVKEGSRKAVGRESEGSRKARKNEQRWKVARKKIKYDGNNCERRLELKDLGVMGGGCGDGLRRGGEE